MALPFHPKPGEIFMCSFPDEYIHGEMIKTRPVIILNRKINGRPRLVNVVPLSMTAPDPVRGHHVKVDRMHLPKGIRDKEGDRWAKCDMVYTMSIDRLDLVRGHRSNSGARVVDKGSLPAETLLAVRLAAAKCLGVHAGSFGHLYDAKPVLASVIGLPGTSANQDGVTSVEAINPA